MQMIMPFLSLAPAFNAGLLLSLSLIMALGPQNAHVIRMGLQGQHLWLTVFVCMASDAVLIGLGVSGLAQLGSLSEWLKTALVGGGIVFLLLYGAQAFKRFWTGHSSAAQTINTANSSTMTRKQATRAALAFAWLNPHAWLDTAVLIGTASLAWGYPANAAFGVGAVLGSFLWFSGLGLFVLWLGQRLGAASRLWRAMDLLVALMMWVTAVLLAMGLLGL